MPRRRKTCTASTRAEPKVPDGDEGANLEVELKTEKLTTLLKDFDTQMRSFYADLKENVSDYERGLECVYTVEIAKVPKYIRDMSLDDYLDAGGELTSTQLLGSDKVTQDMAMDIENDIGLATLTKSKKKKTVAKRVAEENRATLVKLKLRGKKHPLSSLSDASNMAHLNASRTRRPRHKDAFMTPAHGADQNACGWDTPLVTPKFDPRLPITPAMSRQAKKGEVLMSLAGSPITTHNATKTRSKAHVDDMAGHVNEVMEELENIQLPDYSLTTSDLIHKLNMFKDKLMQYPRSPLVE